MSSVRKDKVPDDGTKSRNGRERTRHYWNVEVERYP